MPTHDDEMAEFLEPEEAQPAATKASSATIEEPAWRAKVRGSTFGQVAVVLVASFAILIAAWVVLKPQDKAETQANGEAMSQVQVDNVQQPPTVGELAPSFTATDITGNQISLEELRGRPVWLMFMATWCTGCRTEIPDVQAVISSYGADIQLVVVYVGEDDATVQGYSNRVGNDFTQIADRTQQISAAYGIMGVPSHYFIDASGVVTKSHVGVLAPDAMVQHIAEVAQ